MLAKEDELRTMINTLPVMAWSTGPDGYVEFLNQRWLDYSGLLMEEGIGTGWAAAIHPQDLDRTLETWQSHLKSGTVGQIETRLRSHDGTYRWFLMQAQPLRDGSGQIVRWYGTNTDIDELKQAQEQLSEDERELRVMTDAIPHLINVLGPDGAFIYANEALMRYTGFTPEEIRAEDFRLKMFHPDDFERTSDERADALKRGVAFELEIRLRESSGSYRWFLIRYKPLKDANDVVIRWYATGTDIDERKRAQERLQNENLALREELDGSSMFEEIIGSSEVLRAVLLNVAKVAPADSTVLVLGETGTGKELIARAIHNRSGRSKRAFIRVNCAAIPASLVAAELFGYEKGAFTGALQRRIGRCEAADGGTLFLDEIGDLQMEIQVMLLRVLQEKEFERLGSNHPISVDVRIITATNRDLRAAVAAGTFRQDLFYRLSVFPIQLPSLRERVDDIPLLAEYLIERYSKKSGRKIRSIKSGTLALLQAYDWPGNIRELQNVVERAVILCDSDEFSVDESWFIREPSRPTGSAAPLELAVADREREIIAGALKRSHGRVGGPSGAAATLGIPRQTLESKITNLGINKHQFKGENPN
jgi:formate hydrogenlyase transcriptional activator